MYWNIASFVLGILVTLCYTRVIAKKNNKEIDNIKLYLDKLSEFYSLLLRWLKIRQKNISIASYIKSKGFNTVAIYGMKELGEFLLAELDETEVNVSYCIDRNAENIYIAKDIYTPDMDLPCVDLIIITAIHYYDEIEQALRKKINCEIISLDDLLWEVDI